MARLDTAREIYLKDYLDLKDRKHPTYVSGKRIRCCVLIAFCARVTRLRGCSAPQRLRCPFTYKPKERKKPRIINLKHKQIRISIRHAGTNSTLHYV